MGNCLPKLRRKNKVSHGLTFEVEKERERSVSEILSGSSSSVSLPSLSSDEDINMVKALKLSTDDDTSVDTLGVRKDGNITEELKDKGKILCFKHTFFPNLMSMGESNTDVSAYTLYKHLQQYCSHPSMYE